MPGTHIFRLSKPEDVEGHLRRNHALESTPRPQRTALRRRSDPYRGRAGNPHICNAEPEQRRAHFHRGDHPELRSASLWLVLDGCADSHWPFVPDGEGRASYTRIAGCPRGADVPKEQQAARKRESASPIGG